MDGSNNNVYISEDVHLPNGLTLLQSRRELCWVDAGNQRSFYCYNVQSSNYVSVTKIYCKFYILKYFRLACVHLNEGTRRVVFAPLEYPFGLTNYKEERFFWTDWKE